MSNNLAEYSSQNHNSTMANKAQLLKQDDAHEQDDSMGPSVSMAMEAEDDYEFERSTFNLKRTCSMGLLDEYIDPTRKLLGRPVNSPYISTSSGSTARTSPERSSKDAGSCVRDFMDPNEQQQDRMKERRVGIMDAREVEFHNPEGREPSPELNGLVAAHIEDSKSPPEPDADSYMLPLDDIDVHHEPNRHVDYLSHNWEESDVSQSWKYIILKKKQKGEQDLVNAARLENASWRTWAKARNNLQTVSPEMVNWSKDSDVTWLYGPIVRNSGVCTSNKLSSSVQEQEELGYGSGDEASQRVSKKRVDSSTRPVSGSIAGPKPILKKRTVSEIIEENSLWRLTVARQHRKQITDANSIMDGYGHKYQYDDYDALAARVNSQYYVNSELYNVPAKSPSPLGITTTQSASTLVPLASNPINSPENFQQPALSGPKVDTEVIAKVPVLASILTSTNSEKDRVKDRHIHFNDRVEQCMAINHHSDNDDDDNDNEHEEYGYDDYFGDEDINNEYASNFTGGHTHTDRYANSSHRDDSSGEEDVDEDEGGLFISATLRKTDNSSHVQTDISSYGSSTIGPGGRYSIPLIIKMLPATTLNYGSDDEFYHNRDYYSGNAVSHNVNTYRGYDYVYDYNSVYTADTSNFLTFQKCDIVDVPEDLRTPVSEDLPTPFIFDNTASCEQPKGPRTVVPVKSPQEQQVTQPTIGERYPSLFVGEENVGSSESGEESVSSDSNLVSAHDTTFLGKEKSSDSLSLKRTHSLGKCSGSLHDLQYRKPSIAQTHNFITGKQVPPKSGGPLSRLPAQQQQEQQEQEHAHSQRPVLVKRSSSSKSFIFGDSDSESESASESESESYAAVQPAQISHPLSNESNVRSPFSLPTRNTSASTSPKSIPPPNFGNFGSSNSHASLSDVAIPGYISPRHSSMQSVISKEKIINVKNGYASGTNTSEDNDHSKSLDLDSVNKTFENYHFDSTTAENCEKFDRSSQSSGRMMEMASKYLNSWKR